MLTNGREDRFKELFQNPSNKTQIYTFGIGNGCDINMLQRIAKDGRGACSLIGDNVLGLNGLVITALARASYQSLQGLELAFGN